MVGGDQMSCVVCKAQERDLNDIQRRIAGLVIDQQRAMTVAERDYIGLEVRALSIAKTEFERRHLQHKKSSQHEDHGFVRVARVGS
jgi:hypothetical protein